MTKNKIKVSIIVPVYNADIYLEECLHRIINVKYKSTFHGAAIS